MTKAKIKISDDIGLRNELEKEYESSSQVQLCRYAMLLADHVLELADHPDRKNDVIKEGLLMNEQWQKGLVRVHEVRQASFKIHQLAKTCEDVAIRSVLRAVGHAVATAHMKEHAMVASDYAIKVIDLLHPDDLDAVRNERLWQLDTLKEIRKQKESDRSKTEKTTVS